MLSLDVYRGARASVKDELLVAWRVPEDAIIQADIVQHQNHVMSHCCEIPLGQSCMLEFAAVDQRDQLVDRLKVLDLGNDFGLAQLFGDC